MVELNCSNIAQKVKFNDVRCDTVTTSSRHIVAKRRSVTGCEVYMQSTVRRQTQTRKIFLHFVNFVRHFIHSTLPADTTVVSLTTSVNKTAY